jgi:hypothetical protein
MVVVLYVAVGNSIPPCEFENKEFFWYAYVYRSLIITQFVNLKTKKS